MLLPTAFVGRPSQQIKNPFTNQNQCGCREQTGVNLGVLKVCASYGWIGNRQALSQPQHTAILIDHFDVATRTRIKDYGRLISNKCIVSSCFQVLYVCVPRFRTLSKLFQMLGQPMKQFEKKGLLLFYCCPRTWIRICTRFMKVSRTGRYFLCVEQGTLTVGSTRAGI